MTLMKTLVAATLYAAVALGANPAFAQSLDIDALKEMRVGDMRKLAFHSTPKEANLTPFQNKEGVKMDITAFQGKVVLLNFWATWCAPCRKEMPQLDALQQELGGDDFAVVTVATGRNPVPAIELFFKQAGVTSLPMLRDPQQRMARSMAVLGLPMTMILNREGQEIARMRGEAEWDSDAAKAILRTVIEQTASGS